MRAGLRRNRVCIKIQQRSKIKKKNLFRTVRFSANSLMLGGEGAGHSKWCNCHSNDSGRFVGMLMVQSILVRERDDVVMP